MASLIEDDWQIAFIVICTSVILALAFWLLMMSNMGPTYLPNICNGCPRYMGQNDVTRGWYQPLGVDGCLDYLAHIALFISFDKT
ncbi:hypothetical protein [Psychrobacter sp. KH172YL61]|uniref:hypothetical protein n=1 Tax=Psychrobacter sp. KH172YL61 TaxID=2517899 RepID=UPI001F087BA1|nr:hypothetical protein [Psychrobacter sp. KH172YL61]